MVLQILPNGVVVALMTAGGPPSLARHGTADLQQMTSRLLLCLQAGPPPGPDMVPMERVVEDVAAMGFSRERVRAVLRDLADSGQSIDLNVVLDRLAR